MSTPPRALLSYIAARALPALMAMALTFMCIQSLQAADYARYSLAMLTAGVAASFVGGASAQAMLRYGNDLSPQALRRGLTWVPCLGAALACPLVLAHLTWRTGVTMTALLATASIPLLVLIDTRRSLFIARGNAVRVFALDASRAVLGLLLTGILLASWGAYAAAPMLAQLLAAGASLVAVASRAAFASTGDRRVDAQYVAYGAGLAGWMAVIVGLSLAERYFVADIVGLADSGRYAAQADVINAIFSAAAGALASAMMPSYLTQSSNPDAEKLRHLRRQGLLGVVAIAAMCVVLGAVLGILPLGHLSATLVGDAATGVTLIVAAAIWAAAGFVQKPVELRGQTWRLLGGVSVAFLLFFAIAPSLADRFASLGVAGAKMLAGCAYCAIASTLARKP